MAGVDFGAVSSIVFQFGMFIFGIVLVGGIVTVLLKLLLTKKRYDHTVIILEKDGFGTTRFLKDLGGIYVHPTTKNKRFFLKKNNVGLNPDNIPITPNERGKKYVFLVKVGLKNYKYIGFTDIFDGAKPTVGEEDVNWAINAYEGQKKIFGSTLLHQLVPYIGIIIMGVFILGLVAVVFQKITVIADAAKALEVAAQAMAQAKTGTTVIT